MGSLFTLWRVGFCVVFSSITFACCSSWIFNLFCLIPARIHNHNLHFPFIAFHSWLPQFCPKDQQNRVLWNFYIFHRLLRWIFRQYQQAAQQPCCLSEVEHSPNCFSYAFALGRRIVILRKQGLFSFSSVWQNYKATTCTLNAMIFFFLQMARSYCHNTSVFICFTGQKKGSGGDDWILPLLQLLWRISVVDER